MSVGRREFLIGAGTLVASARPVLGRSRTRVPARFFPASVRADFPLALQETYLNAAAIHPLGTFAARAVEQTLAYRLRGPGENRGDFGADKQKDLKKRYGQLINATPNEIAFTSSTSDGENIVVMGLDLAEARAATS